MVIADSAQKQLRKVPGYRDEPLKGKRAGQRSISLSRACIGLHTSPIMSLALPMYLRRSFVKDGDLEPIAGAPHARYVLKL